jgi:hypothetical protein
VGGGCKSDYKDCFRSQKERKKERYRERRVKKERKKERYRVRREKERKRDKENKERNVMTFVKVTLLCSSSF